VAKAADEFAFWVALGLFLSYSGIGVYIYWNVWSSERRKKRNHESIHGKASANDS
jgi:hypothetical protein